MKVSVAEGSGFCYGVRRAMDMAYKHTRPREKGVIYSLRQIIHNPQEVKRLEQAGAKHVDTVQRVKKGAPVIISAHGIPAREEKLLNAKKAKILDTTCPYVKKIHKIVRKLAKERYYVVVVGDGDHNEVDGIMGQINSEKVVINKISDIKKMKPKNKIGIVSQTTQNAGFYSEVINEITRKFFKKKYVEVRSFNTICDATRRRQEATKKLAEKADVMVIIGGRNSANTRRLYELSREKLKDVYHIETEKELRKSWFENKKHAGVSAGASTPERVINKAVRKIRSMK